MAASQNPRRLRRLLVVSALAAVVIAAVGATTFVALDIASATPKRHTLMHIGCKHGAHAHGLPWHAGHGKSLTYDPGLRRSRPEAP